MIMTARSSTGARSFLSGFKKYLMAAISCEGAVVMVSRTAARTRQKNLQMTQNPS